MNVKATIARRIASVAGYRKAPARLSDITIEIVIDNGLTDIVEQRLDAGVRLGTVRLNLLGRSERDWLPPALVGIVRLALPPWHGLCNTLVSVKDSAFVQLL